VAVGSNPTGPTEMQNHPTLRELYVSLDDYVRWASRRYAWSTVERDRRVLYKLKKAGLLDVEQSRAVDFILNYPGATAGTKHIMLHGYLRWLRYVGVRPEPNTLQTLQDLNRLRERKLAKIPSRDVALAVIGVIRPSQTRRFYTLIMETGLRFSEALHLRWSQVDLDGGRLVIERSEKRSEGSILPLTEAAKHALQEQRLITGGGEMVFTVTKQTIIRTLEKAKRKMAHLPGAELVCAKNLRHLFATRLYSITKDLVYVQRMLRHRSILTTQRYVHMVTDRKAYEVKVVPAYDKTTISMLLEQGFDVVLSQKDTVYLRRLKE
jgi:integrase